MTWAPTRSSASLPRAVPGLSGDGFDLLRLHAVRALVQWHGFPYVFQAFMLVTFVALMWLSWGVWAPGTTNAKLFAKSNLTTLLIWGLWWPAMIWLTVLFGRVWCMICPLELVSTATERLGRALGMRPYAPGRWLIAGWIAVVLYALIQLTVAAGHINRVPAYTSLFLLALIAAAAVAGLLFTDRAFCRAFCPVGQLLAAYGRGGMLAVRAGSAEACAACTGKDCLRACNRTKWDARSCPSLLNPPKLNSNRDCLVCGQCIKSCEPDNMRLLLRRPFHPKDAREPLASWPATAFVMLVSGFVIWELSAEWPAAEAVFLAVPEWASEHVGVAWVGGSLNWLWALGVVPLLAWSGLAWAGRVAGDASAIGLQWRRMALPLAVVVAAGHMIKGLAKFVSWAGFLPSALRDPDGVATVTAIGANAAAPPGALLSPPTVAAVGIALIATALLLSYREARLAHPDSTTPYRDLMPSAFFAALFVFVTCGVGWGAR